MNIVVPGLLDFRGGAKGRLAAAATFAGLSECATATGPSSESLSSAVVVVVVGRLRFRVGTEELVGLLFKELVAAFISAIATLRIVRNVQIDDLMTLRLGR